MGKKTGIEWATATWNPVTGCTRISEGCQNCYAERMARRLMAMGSSRYKNGFIVTMHEDALRLPLQWIKPQRIFVNSMGDLFHQDVSMTFVLRVFNIMGLADWHTYMVLTKRPDVMAISELCMNYAWPDHVWAGVSIENARELPSRLAALAQLRAAVKFISFEPLLGPVGRFDLTDISWVIVGGESGPGARPMKEEWVTEIRDQCIEKHVPFFFKQWGGVQRRQAGRSLQGRTWEELPTTKAPKKPIFHCECCGVMLDDHEALPRSHSFTLRVCDDCYDHGH